MSRLDWSKAERDSRAARERHEQGARRKSGQSSRMKTNTKPTTAKQRDYIATLQAETGTREPVPPSAWQASRLIDHLQRLRVKQHRRV